MHKYYEHKHETHKRSVVKAVTYRIFGTLGTIILVYIFTGKLVLSLQLGFLELITKILLYYGHERVWHKVKWGTYYK